MKRCLTSTFCNLVLIGTCLPWDCVGDEVEVVTRRNVRRRTRFVAPRFDDTEDTLLALASLTREDEDFASRVSSYSMPNKPTIPAKPPVREDRAILIQNKCGVTAIERSRDILTELLTVSDASALTNPYTSQFKAREWVDKNDPAIICSINKKRIDQRYRLALLYYELGGSTWTRCRAEEDVDDSTEEEECPGIRFLDKSNECEWDGMICGDSFNVATAEWLDAYYPLEVLNLQSNNLSGKLYKEFYDFPKLKEIFLNDNSISGTISEEIGNFKDVTVLQLDANLFDGSVPEQGLFEMKKLAGLSIQENDLQGSLDELCDVMYDRRFEFESYLTLKMEADCLGNSPKVYCECCSTCH